MSIRYCYVNTVPRSGTYFFDYLITNYVIHHPSVESAKACLGGLSLKRLASSLNDFMEAKLGAGRFKRLAFIDHSSSAEGDPLYAALLDVLSLDYYQQSHSYPQPLSQRVTDLSSFDWYSSIPKIDWEATRVVFLYRNPLDQAVSFYNHVYRKDYKEEPRNAHTDFFGTCNGPGEMLRAFSSSYLKFYLSHAECRDKYPDNVMFLSYEGLVCHTSDFMEKVLAFLGCDVSSDALKKAIQSTSIEKMKSMEESSGEVLGGDLRKQRNVSHMSNGEVGKWKRELSDQDVEWIRREFKEYGVTLDSFVLE